MLRVWVLLKDALLYCRTHILFGQALLIAN